MASKTLQLLALMFLSVTTHFAFVTAQDFEREIFGGKFQVCSNIGTFTDGSSYRALNTLLGSLSSSISNNGFYSASAGGAYGVALCRADIQLDTCRSCVGNLSQDIQIRCPNRSEAVMWQDFCMVRYSNQPIAGKLAIEPHANASVPPEYTVRLVDNEVRTKLFDDLRAQAVNGVAADSRPTPNNTDTTNIYAMVQCTPDLSPEDCANCWADAMRQISQCCLETWAILYKPSCSIRYDSSPFYNLTRLQQPLQPSPAGNDENKKKNGNIIIIVVSIVVFLLVASCVGLFAIRRQKQKKTGEPQNVKDGDPVGKDGDQIISSNKTDQISSSVEAIQYDIGEIRAATDDFSDANKLGQGGFGTVYKGTLQNGQVVAVKRLSKNSCQGDLEFKNEVLLLAKLQHKNLVRLLGFSREGIEKLLVYEFVQNGSLDYLLFDPVKSSNLDWDRRYKIIEGIAKGLLYLHEDSRLKIIHRDLKAGNILLDEKMEPKITDFGLAKLVLPNVTHAITERIIGTQGYMAPEYAIHGHFSIKSDVYSFGIMILEIITGQKNENNSGDLISHAWRSWREQTSKHMIDPGLMDKSGDQQDMLMRCIHIALLCIQQNPDIRPKIVDIIQLLDNFSLTLPVPSKPEFYNPSSFSKAIAAQDPEND